MIDDLALGNKKFAECGDLPNQNAASFTLSAAVLDMRQAPWPPEYRRLQYAGELRGTWNEMT